MTIWRPDLSGRSGPKFRQLSDAIGEAISDGRLGPGARLPPQRDLAYDLGLSLNTVSRAYADAVARGYLQGEVGRGTYVRASEPASAAEPAADMARPESGPIDFSRNLPATSPAAEALAATLAELSASIGLSALLDYQRSEEQVRHQRAAAAWLATAGLETAAQRIAQTSGAQHATLAALLTATRPGDVLLTEALTYAPVKAMAERLSLRIAPVPTEDGALSPEALDAVCARVAAKALYCLPTLHTPTTATMTADRRQAVAAIARKRDLTIIEDDVFGFLPPDRPPPLACFAPERTLYLNSASKCMAPGLRVGWMVFPERYERAVRSAIALSTWMPPPIMSEIATRWIEDGTADRLAAFQREEAAARQALAGAILPATLTTADPHGLHLWLRLPEPWRPELFRMAAARRGVELTIGDAFAAAPAHRVDALRLCLSHEPSRVRVEQGLRVIAELLEGGGEEAAMIL